MSLPVLTKPVVAKRTPPGPEVITVLGGFALLAGIMLMFAGIVLAVPSHSRWDYGPGLIGFWIMLGFGYVGFAQYLPRMYVAMIVVLAILYLAAGIGFLSGRRWAWTLGIMLALVGVASSILQTVTWAQQGDGFYAVPGLIVAVLVLVYFTRTLARNFLFGRR
ncbi:hypothetical protein E6H32_09265 [Candidatus Bathyarchaeota archaeon]|nr:MAG: hypothetical protein E6H32_09265 [Candidatus Bathyarchaeota archaeon]